MGQPRPVSFGQCMSQGQLRQLQWIVPIPWASELSSMLTRFPIAGARVRFTSSGEGTESSPNAKATERWVGFFDAERMVEEALRPAAYALSSSQGLLPIAGCGRRGAALYLVAVGVSDLPVWYWEGTKLQPLNVGLAALWASSEPHAGVRLRRRIPEKTPRRLAKTSGSALRSSGSRSACPRTLPLFA
jgi:hypothetical protein